MLNSLPSSFKRIKKSHEVLNSFIANIIFELSYNKLLQFIIGIILILLAGEL